MGMNGKAVNQPAMVTLTDKEVENATFSVKIVTSVN